MRYTFLGNSDLEVSVIGLGCSGMSMGNKLQSDPDSIATIHRALELGVNFFDTSDAYGNGHNERLVAAAVEKYKKTVVIGTKFGNMRGPQGQRLGINGKPDYVPIACEASLKRLGLEAIDLYYLHRIDPEVPIEDTVGAMATLVEQGKVRYLGLSEAKPGILRRAHAVHPITALESEYSLWTREAEVELLPLCRELEITYVAYAPLGRGFLTGTIKTPGSLAEGDRRHQHPRFWEKNLRKNLSLLKPVEQIAKEKGCDPAQVALAWILSQKHPIVPIPGTTHSKYLENNTRSIDIELATEEIALLSTIFQKGIAAGTRYPEKQMPLMGF
jgi:aryl-alcohol dehydrogenase-like predicted oxidoreductase